MSASNLETPINTTTSISNYKVENVLTDTPKQNDPKITGYRFIDIEILLDVIEILCCSNAVHDVAVEIMTDDYEKIIDVSVSGDGSWHLATERLFLVEPDTYVSLTRLKFGSYNAVANIKIGKKSSILILEILRMIPGRYMVKQCDTLSRKGLFYSTYKSSEEVRKRRKVHRGQKKSSLEATKLGEKQNMDKFSEERVLELEGKFIQQERDYNLPHFFLAASVLFYIVFVVLFVLFIFDVQEVCLFVIICTFFISFVLSLKSAVGRFYVALSD